MARNIAERNTWIDIHRYIHEKRSLEMAGGVLGDDKGGGRGKAGVLRIPDSSTCCSLG